ncbi:hypothetical protein B9Y72_08765 [Stenotrophomonas maltophilia]|nr:hypothetical protein B9Y68_08765 [Stenotrophomonas maltophilia]PJL21893.1 hypothetical protein B9Y72_08765 [Stenotrophomonas maltophilia]
MDNAFLIIVLAVACISVGIVRIGSWVIARNEQEQTRIILQQVYAACATSNLRQLEIEATKRGDLLAAARFAEQQEAVHG